MNEVAIKTVGEQEEWESKLVEEILVIEDGDRGKQYPKKADFQNTGHCLFLSTKNVRPNGFLFEDMQFITKEKHEALRKGTLVRGDIVFTSRGTIGNIAHYDTRVEYDCVRINSGMILLRGFLDHLDAKYLEYYLRSPYVKNQIATLQTGTAQPQLPIKDFKKFRINYPKDIEQQKRIVAKIEELFSHIDAGIEALNKAKQLLKQYRQSVLKAAVTGELTKEWREQNKDKLEPASQLLERILTERRQKWEEQQLEQFKAKGKMPKNDKWKEKYKEPFEILDENSVWLTMEVGELFDCLVPNRDKPKTFTGDIPWVTTPMLNEINVSISYEGENLGLSSEEVNKYNARLIPENSVVMTCVGRLGVSVVADQDCVINQQLHCFLPSKYYMPKLLAFFLQAKEKFMDSIATATTIQYLNKTNCNSVPIPVMSMLEQEVVLDEIENRIESFSRLDNEIDKQLIKAEKNKQSVLASAFSGSLL